MDFVQLLNALKTWFKLRLNKEVVDIDANWIKSKIKNKNESHDTVFNNVVDIIHNLLGKSNDNSRKSKKKRDKGRVIKWHIIIVKYILYYLNE